ncbi:type II secretion system F family protein [Alloacidobacterium dinghuense]|uniref:Type II secretion system F family protein n=1 Tax=Alloacidobacterium dinghuense TaxID=2763107 RepID=A0A7G8BK12_9BACT|nr:type II secretion system F family protein [Alloacidobacterium dinghuense]QNI32882.1 type II secretion system F family protein [Alloacidobacterium dinghuense]
MGFAAITFLVIFLLIASGGLLLFYREAMMKRLSDVVTPRVKRSGGLKTAIQQTGSTIGGAMGQLERFLPKSQAEASVIQQRLTRAGLRSESAPKILYGAKVLVPLVLCTLAMVSGAGSYSPFIVYALALGLGFIGPDFWLGRKISRRQAQIRRGLPDVLDLLVICIEAGLSLDHATARTAEELERVQPAISDELSITVLEQRAGIARADAWRHLAERTGVESVRNLVTILIQSEKFGTSVAKTLRTHSDTLRTQRRQKVEELAAKTTVKLVFPLVFFIFPSLFLVTLGPAGIVMAESFQKYFSH